MLGSDWAAHGPIISRIEDVNSNPTTPGLHVPGAFPDLYPKSDVQQDMQYAKNTAISAKEYVSTSVEDVKCLMEDTGDTVGGSLPQSVNTCQCLPPLVVTFSLFKSSAYMLFIAHFTSTDSNNLHAEPKSQALRSASF